MKRISVFLLIAIQFILLCSCQKSVDFFKKEPPKIPDTFRANTVINGEKLQMKAVTDLKTDGSVEFLITEHETLKGLVFRSTADGFEMTADGITVDVGKAHLPKSAILSTLGNALRHIQKTSVEPVECEGFFEYRYPDEGFVIMQNAVSGEIVSIDFKDIGYTVNFIK